jgi:hypothetical protein
MTQQAKKHTLDDHLMGADGLHEHDDESDHDHDHDDFAAFDPENDALFLADRITLLSVGIDIGSSGTQVIFSRVHMRRLSEELTSRYFVVERETLYQSPVALTPYQSESRIDERAVGDIIDAAYAARDCTPTRSTRAQSSSPAKRCGARMPRASPRSSPRWAASSSAPPPATTWNRCSRPTGRAPRRPPTT